MKGTMDVLYIPITLLTLAIMVVVGYYILSELNANPILNSATSIAVLNSWKMWNNVFMFIAIGLSIVTIVLSFFIPTHPIFIAFEIMLIILGVFVSPIYSNMYAEFATNALINPSANQFPTIALVMGTIPTFTAVISAVVALVTYSKRIGSSNGVAGM